MVEVVTMEEFLEVKHMLQEILRRLPESPKSNKKEYLTAKEVKEVLQCSDSTLSNYRKSGMLSANRVGGRFYYSQTDLNNLLEQQKGGEYGK